MRQLSLLAHLDDEEPPAELPPMCPFQEVVADYQNAGLTLRNHPLSFYRSQLARLGAVPAADLATLPAEKRYRVAGLVILRQRPGTAKGITFVTIEDETGIANLVIHPKVWERFHRVCRRSSAVLVTGHLQRQHEVIHLVVHRLQDLPRAFDRLDAKSRDFR